ncbi:MAG: TIM barrel protein [Patescibacteria group bacterium]
MLHFAVAGAPLSTPKPGGTVKGLERAAALGITAMEVEWVQSVPTSVERMEEIRAVATKHKVALTVHAPYYINLNSLDPAKLTASKKRIIDALAMSELCGARSVCVHPAFYGGMDHDEVYDRVRDATESMLKHKDKLFPHVNLAYETMGKPSQFGTLDEVLKLSAEFGLYPCLDPAHMHARTNGEYNSAKEWNEMFDLYEHYLGKPALKNVHMHFSGIAYGEKGEQHHLPLRESDANWKEFLQVLKDRKIEGNLVCESPLLEKDTLLLKETFEKLS